MTHGEKLRVPGKGGKGGKGVNGAPDGDLYLDIEIAEHPLYRISGQDIFVDLPLSPWESALGTTVQLPTPGGTVSLKVPAGTHAGQQLRLTGRGFTRGADTTGNLFAIVRLVMPTALDDRQRELYRQLAEASSFDPRAHFEPEAAR